jgi:hypothetical protein
MCSQGIVLLHISCEIIHIRSNTPRLSISSADRVSLVAEPSNPHDRHAIAVFSNDAKVGYIPRRIARSLQRMLLDSCNVSWTVNLSASDAATLDGNEDADDAIGSIIDIAATADHDCDGLSLLRIQADAVIAAAAVKRLSTAELHAKFLRDSITLLRRLHSSCRGSTQGEYCVMSSVHAELADSLATQDDAALSLLSRLLQRRAMWVQASALKLQPTSTTLSALVSIGAVVSTSQRISSELALSLLPSLPLPLLAKLSRAINAKQCASKRDILREIHNAAFKQRTLFGGPMDLASAIMRCLNDASPFISVLPNVRRLCGRAASYTFLGAAAPAAVIAAITSEYDESTHDDVNECNSNRCSLTHSHSGCLSWFKVLPMIEIGLVDRPCEVLMSASSIPPQPFVTHFLSDFEMSDCDFAKDCLDAALWIGGKPAASNSSLPTTCCSVITLMSCAALGARDYILRHGCIARSSPSAQLLSFIFELIPSPPPNFPCALTLGADTRTCLSLPKALADATISPPIPLDSSLLEAAATVVRVFTILNASEQDVDSPMCLLQALPHMQPYYVSRFSSIYIYCKTLHCVCPMLETQGMHAHACIVYVLLLSLPFLRHRRAHWWTRLCINFENARFLRTFPPIVTLSDKYNFPNLSLLLRMCQDSSKTPPPLSDSLLLCALGDKMIYEENMHCLIQRAHRFADGRSTSECSKTSMSSAISGLSLAALICAPEVIIEGRPSNRTAGQKSHFIGFDDSVGVSVEEFALQW